MYNLYLLLFCRGDLGSNPQVRLHRGAQTGGDVDRGAGQTILLPTCWGGLLPCFAPEHDQVTYTCSNQSYRVVCYCRQEFNLCVFTVGQCWLWLWPKGGLCITGRTSLVPLMLIKPERRVLNGEWHVPLFLHTMEKHEFSALDEWNSRFITSNKDLA